MIIRVTLYLALLAAGSYGTLHLKVQFSYGDLKGYLDSLINASAMIFTIMGIWIAFLYPNALSRLVDPKKVAIADFSEALQETKRLEKIVGSVLKSGTVVLGALSISLGKLLFGAAPALAAHLVELKAFTLALVCVLSLLQVEAVIAVILANVLFLADLHRRREEREAANDI